MKTITLKILAEDFKPNGFQNVENCVLTKSVKRYNSTLEGHFSSASEPFKKNHIDYPKEVFMKVKQMYAFLNPEGFRGLLKEMSPLEPQDFTFELEVPDNW